MKRVPAWAYSAVQMALAGGEPPEIARALSKPERSVKRLLGSGWAKEQLEGWHRAVMDGTAKARMDPILQFQSHITRAITKLVEKLDSEDEKVQYLAACRILDNAGLRPAQRVEVAEDQLLRDLTPEQMRYVATHGGQMPPSLVTLPAVATAIGVAVATADAEADPTNI